jgi:general secretion pathway protein A
MRQPPFESNSEACFFFESETHGEALARLFYLVSDGGMGMGALTGKIGSGKTMLINVLESRLRQDLYTTIRLHTAHLPFEHILAEINSQLRDEAPSPDAPQEKYYLLKEFKQLLENKVGSLGKHLILILDEAQFLSPECLDELKCLTNFNQKESVMTLLLSGQSDLKEKLRALPQVYQRLGMFYDLQLLRQEEVGPYLRHRLRIAGAENMDIFDKEGIEPLFVFSGGCPRQINRICKLAVDRACLMKKERVDVNMVRMIIRDIEKHFG